VTSARGTTGLTTDFPEDDFAATGKYLRTIAGGSDRPVTSATGKIVYYSGLRTYDTTRLADRVWSRNSNEQNLALSAIAREYSRWTTCVAAR